MALAGHEVVINVGANELDGIKSFSISNESDLLDETDFADTSGFRKRFQGLQDGTISLSGDYEPADTAQLALISGKAAGTTVSIALLYDGASGDTVTCHVESFDISGEVGGLVEFSCSLKFNAAPT